MNSAPIIFLTVPKCANLKRPQACPQGRVGRARHVKEGKAMRRMSKGVLALSALGMALSFVVPAYAASTADVQAVLDLVNQQRAAAGLQPLRLQSQLMQSAQGYADQLNNGIPFSH